MNLTEVPEEIIFEDMHYLYLESGGPFSESARKLWTEFHSSHFAKLKSNPDNAVKNVCSLYKTKPDYLYRAGASVQSAPATIPEGLLYEHFKGGKYACFLLTGSFEHLPKACGRVFEIVKETNLQLRDSFYIENYLNDPSTTPVEKLQTQILVPIL